MTTLNTFANLWTLWNHPEPGAGEWSLETKVAAVAEAGFDAVMGEPDCGIGGLAKAHGLAFAAFSRLDGRHNFRQVLEACRAEGAIVLQVHLGWHDTPAEEALTLAVRLDAAPALPAWRRLLKPIATLAPKPRKRRTPWPPGFWKRPVVVPCPCCWISRIPPSSNISIRPMLTVC